MADLGHIEIVVLDTTGVAVNGATCAIRPQGTYLSQNHSTNDSTLFVREPNGITTTMTVGMDTDSDGPYTINSISSHTSFSISPNLTAGHTAYQRVTVRSAVSNFCYKDQFAAAAVDTTNQVSTNSNGYAHCYAKAGLYDVLISGGTPAITSRLMADVPAVGPGHTLSNLYTVGNAGTAYIFDTLRNLAQSGDKLMSFRTNNGSTELWYLTYNGTNWRTINNCHLIVGGGLYVDDSGVDGTPPSAGGITAKGNISTDLGLLCKTPSPDSGTSGYLTITNTTSTAVSTGTATIKTTTSSNINSTGFLKVYDGTTTRYIPFFNVTG